MSKFIHRLNQRIKDNKFLSYIITMQYLPRWTVFLLDVFLAVVAYAISHYLSFAFLDGNSMGSTIGSAYRLPVLIAVQAVGFWIFHTYSGVLRYSGFIDAFKVLSSVLFTVIVLYLINLVVWLKQGMLFFYNRDIAIYLFVAFVLLFSLRMFVKTLFELFVVSAGSAKRVMIYGTKSAGVAIAKMLRSSVDERYKLVGFIDDSENYVSRVILGVRVYKLDGELVSRMQRLRVESVIVSPMKMQEINPAVDLDIFLNNNINILAAPYVSMWKNVTESESPKISQIKSIQIEDLLERPAIHINLENLNAFLNDSVVMVTGAAGSIGSELVRQVIKYSPRLIVLLDQAESPLHDFMLDLQHSFPQHNFTSCIADVRNRKRIDDIMDLYRPDVIYHAAAYKHVPLMEDNPSESIQANVMGTKNMADMAVKYEVKRFVMVSTDKAVNPTNIMGASKRIAEIYVQSLYDYLVQKNPDCTKFITTRFGNVLGSNGSVIPYFKKQIEQGGPVTVTHPEIIRYFMTIPEACQLVLEAGMMGEGGEIFIFDMGKPVKILDLAKKMIRLAGYKPGVDIKIAFTGLRPGEKLYEELLNKKEKTMPTTNEKIMVAKVQKFDYEQVKDEINLLIDYSYLGKDFLTVSQMKKIVPEYVSKNSPYEKLDI